MFGYAGERLLLTLWVGALWSIGYLAVPVAFATLDQTTAGNYAGVLFRIVNIMGQVCGAVLIISKLYVYRLQARQYWRFWMLVAMVAITLLFSFYLHPEMAQIKQQPWHSDPQLSARFSQLHMISENVYLLLSALGMILVLSNDKTEQTK